MAVWRAPVSHFTKIKTQIVETEFLLKALAKCGWKFRQGDTTVRGWQGANTRAEIVIDVPGTSHQIGFSKNGPTYEIVADWYTIKSTNEADFVKTLTQAYACEVVKGKLAEQGFELAREEEQENKAVHLVMRRMR